MVDRTDVPFVRTVPDFPNIEVDGFAEVEFIVDGGYHGEDVNLTVSIDDLAAILDFARQHHTAYQSYVDGGYEDPDDYWRHFPEVDDNA